MACSTTKLSSAFIAIHPSITNRVHASACHCTLIAFQWDTDWITPRELTKNDIHSLIQDWVDATKRADQARVDLLEIHGAHGYLIGSFLSPLSNMRTDEYGGSLENRSRLCIEIVRAVRAAWPQHKPLAVRLSCTEWMEHGWNMDDTLCLVKMLAREGVDFIDCRYVFFWLLLMYRMDVYGEMYISPFV
jgi:2,4-dienoyl-CoA reductase-like NADH-dependent reductase (Old Yellow Enzyme family)